MSNLLVETLEDMRVLAGKEPCDVTYIGDGSNQCTWSEFADMADKHYDNGFGIAEVVEDLVIVFADGSHLERMEYDGAEGWIYKTPLPPSKEQGRLIQLFYWV